MKLIIIGGGIAGLSAAYYATKKIPHAQITLIESSNQWGGKISTDRVTFDGGQFIIEGGPDTFLATKPWGVALCKELGLGNVCMAPTRNKRTPTFYIATSSSLCPMVLR
jgi:protoporphyrinogen/coproporphyrinogen III oxidase